MSILLTKPSWVVVPIYLILFIPLSLLIHNNTPLPSDEQIEAIDGKPGVEMAKTHKPNLILMDIMMPVMDGIEATRILKADSTTQKIPILAVSSLAMKGDKERIIECGCNGYLAKPFNIHELKEMIAELLSKSSTL